MGGFTPFKQPAERSLFESQRDIPTSAEVGKGVALDPRTFEKVRSKLSTVCFLIKIENFRLGGNSP
jgi:hypothetical protein